MKRCKHCGAQALPLRRVCDYCGTPSGQGFGYSGRADHGGGVAEQDPFERLMAHPDLPGLLDMGPQVEAPRERGEGPPTQVLLMVLFAVFFWKSGGLGRLGSGFSALPLILFGVAFLSILRRRSRRRAFPGTHLESLPVRVIDISTELFWPGRGWVKVTIEQPSGERRRLRYLGSGQELWDEGSMGVAHVKANRLVELHLLPV